MGKTQEVHEGKKDEEKEKRIPKEVHEEAKTTWRSRESLGRGRERKRG